MADNSQFDFYEKVVVQSTNSTYQPLQGQEGVIIGKAKNGDGGWGYAVYMYCDKEVWDLEESSMITTGEFVSRNELYDGSVVRVSSEGELRDDNVP